MKITHDRTEEILPDGLDNQLGTDDVIEEPFPDFIQGTLRLSGVLVRVSSDNLKKKSKELLRIEPRHHQFSA